MFNQFKNFAWLLCLLFSVNAIAQLPDDPAVTKKIQAKLKALYPTVQGEDRKFIYNSVDLNDDGKNEYLVGLVGSYFCGSGGCSMLVLNSSYGVNTKMTVVGFPVYVGPPASKEVTKGYSNLYVYSKGKGNVKMAWNGSKYPTNPSTAPVVSDKVIEGKFAFLDENSLEKYSF
jgi:hypothetical protein